MPSRQVSRKALTCSGSRVMWSALPSCHVATGGGPLEIGVELDAVGRVNVDALDFAAQALALGERGHDLEAVAEDHAVGPVGVVLVELGGAGVFGQAVEIGEEVNLGRGGRGAGLGLAEEVVNQDFGMDLFLDVERRGGNDEVGPIRGSSLPRQTNWGSRSRLRRS